jgi:type 1 glutamine amidotransferase
MKLMSVVKKLIIAITVLAFVAAVALYLFLRSTGLFRAPQYDTQAPELPELNRPAVLVFNKTNGYIHKDAIPAATEMLQDIAAKNNWSIYHTDNAAVHNISDLKRFDLVIWNNTTGDLLTHEQRMAFETWHEQNGAWVGLHAAGGDREYDWDWYRDTLIGAQFFGHTMSPQFQDAEINTADKSKLTSHIPTPWRVSQEEWYAFESNPRATGSEILLTIDETSYDTSESFFREPTMPGEHPMAWTHKVGSGTMIYLAIGHQAHTYSNENYREFVEKSMHHLITQPRLN